MSDSGGALTKAKLIELRQDFKDVKGGGQSVGVQFNPESLKLSFANEIKQEQGGDQASGTGGRQFVGAGTTKLALQLWFDVTAMDENPVDDVRRLTQKVVYFMKAQTFEKDPRKKKVPPPVRFLWGSFLFDGIVESLEEMIDFFSPDGKPLRASVALTLSQQKILKSTFDESNVPARRGRTPLNRAKAGNSLPGLAAKNGLSDWQSIAAANGIEDPLRMAPGQLIDLSAGGAVGASAAVSLGPGAGLQAPVLVPPVSVSPNASIGGGLGGNFSST